MLCPMSLVLEPGCLALSACVLYVNHHTHAYIARVHSVESFEGDIFTAILSTR